mmetsp:Transcript_610/g.1760  ORF Transcript_610/g.1760 Transcript_610/m.1760 type:complete len:260 (-) Transcript_610:942-1721(-)
MATQSIIRRAMSNLLVRRTVLVVSSPVCADRVFGSAAAATRKFGLTGSTQTFSISYTSAGSPLWQSPARRLSAAALPQPIDTESEDEAQSAGNRLSDRIGFIGAGNMGEAMMRGFTSSGVSSADRMSASVRSSERQKKMTSLGFRVFPDALKGGAEQLAANNDIIFLGVKPIYLGGVLKELAPFFGGPPPRDLHRRRDHAGDAGGGAAGGGAGGACDAQHPLLHWPGRLHLRHGLQHHRPGPGEGRAPHVLRRPCCVHR